jgi:GMP synthase-like glutamine amidotransferase
MKILIIDNNIDPPYWGSHDLKTAVQQVAPSAQVMVRRGPQQDFNLNFSEFDKLVISGSKTSCLEKGPWIEALDEFVLRIIQAKKPLLGVCYGHQTLNRVLGGSSYLKKSEKNDIVRKLRKAKYTSLITFTPNYSYFRLFNPEDLFYFSRLSITPSTITVFYKKQYK